MFVKGKRQDTCEGTKLPPPSSHVHTEPVVDATRFTNTHLDLIACLEHGTFVHMRMNKLDSRARVFEHTSLTAFLRKKKQRQQLLSIYRHTRTHAHMRVRAHALTHSRTHALTHILSCSRERSSPSHEIRGFACRLRAHFTRET